jgi:hypothetical protein
MQIRGPLGVVGKGSGDKLTLNDTQGLLMFSYALTSSEVDHAPSAVSYLASS